MVLRAPHTFDQQLTWLHVPSCFPLAPPIALLLTLLKSAGQQCCRLMVLGTEGGKEGLSADAPGPSAKVAPVQTSEQAAHLPADTEQARELSSQQFSATLVSDSENGCFLVLSLLCC